MDWLGRMSAKKSKKARQVKADAPQADLSLPEQEEAAEKPGFFTLGKTGWYCLTFLDALLLLGAVLFRSFVLGAIALLLVVVIEKRGSDVMLEKYNKRMAENAARQISREQQQAIVGDVYERMKRRLFKKRYAQREEPEDETASGE